MSRLPSLFIIILLLISLVFVSLGLGCTAEAPAPAPAPSPAPAPETKVFKLTGQSAFARGSFAHEQELEFWVQPLIERAGGRLEMDFKGAGELVPAGEVFAALGRGALDFGANSWVWQTGIEPVLGITWNPMIYETQAEYVGAFYEAQLPIIDPYMQAKQNQKVLGLVAVSGGLLFTNKPVKTAADMQGLKIRGQGGPTGIFIEKAGAGSVSMIFPEAITGLQQKTLDGVMFPEQVVADMKLFEFLPYAVEQLLVIPQDQACWNLDSWNTLPADLQELIVEHARQVNYYEGIIMAPIRVAKYHEVNLANGVTYNRLSPEDFAKFKQAGYDALDWYAEQSPESAQVAAATRAYLRN